MHSMEITLKFYWEKIVTESVWLKKLVFIILSVEIYD